MCANGDAIEQEPRWLFLTTRRARACDKQNAVQTVPAYRPRRMRRRATAHASGRINLIGEHTDYNDGLVMPVALRLGVTVEAGSREDGIAHLTTDAPVSLRELSYQIGSERKDRTWADKRPRRGNDDRGIRKAADVMSVPAPRKTRSPGSQ